MGQEGHELARMSDITQTIAYKLRLNNLDKTKRTLRQANIEDTNGFLTIDGAQVFLDALWQSHPELQKQIADGIAEMNKETKDKKKK